MENYKIVLFSEDNIEYYGEDAEDSMHILYLHELAKTMLIGKVSASLYEAIQKVGATEYVAAILTNFLDIALALRSTKHDGYITLLLPASLNPKVLENIERNKEMFKKYSIIDFEIPILDDNKNLFYESISIDKNIDFTKSLKSAINKAKIKYNCTKEKLFTK